MASGEVRSSPKCSDAEQLTVPCTTSNSACSTESDSSNTCGDLLNGDQDGAIPKKLLSVDSKVNNKWKNSEQIYQTSSISNVNDAIMMEQASVNGLNFSELDDCGHNFSNRPIHLNTDTWSISGDCLYGDAFYNYGGKCNTFHHNSSKMNQTPRGTSPSKRYSASKGPRFGHLSSNNSSSNISSTDASYNGQHIVLLHVNPGETISFYMGDHMQLIQGPATVRMVSSNSAPPVPMPVQVPPGHMVQQIVDENGTLRHIILSPQPPVAMSLGSPYSSASGSAPAGATTGPSPYFVYPHQSFLPPMQFPPHMHPGMANQGISSHGGHIPQQSANGHGSNVQGHAHSSPSQLSAHKDERTQKQFFKLKKRLEARQKDTVTEAAVSSKNDDVRKDVNSKQSPSDETVKSSANEENTRISELLSSISMPNVTEVTARSALVTWKPPNVLSSTAENSIVLDEKSLSYNIFLSDKGQDSPKRNVYSGSFLEFALKDLKPASTYYVCVQALSENVSGKHSDSAVFKTLSSVPDVPQAPKLLNRTKTSISLKWNAAADNGSKILCYILEYDEGNENGDFVELFKGLQKQYKAIKLKASTSYRFRLAAVNELGRSEYSEAVIFLTCGTTPTQPSPPTLKVATTNSLTLQWEARPNDDDYTLQMEDEGTLHGFLPVYNGKETCYTCFGLQRNTSYKFRLCANNEEGSSPWSQAVNFSTIPDKPASPGRPCLKGRVHSTFFKVAWDPPKDTGGSDITRYELEIDKGNGFELIFAGTEQEYQCEQLQPGFDYNLRVRCYSEGGISTYSDTVVIATSPVAPGKCSPPRLLGKPKAASLHLKWSHPDYDGGSEVSEFEVEVKNPDESTRQVYLGLGTDCVVAGLQPGRKYLFYLRALNKVGPGPWSEVFEANSGPGIPDAPSELQVAPRSPHSVVASWSEPLNNGACITEYHLESNQNDKDFQKVFVGLQLNAEVKGLTPATVYTFRVLAVNSAGSSPYSETVSCTTLPSSPGVISVSSIKVISGTTTIALSWSEPNDHGSPITSYNVEIGDSMYNSVEVPEVCIENLQPETVYRIRIQAVNSIGLGPFSSLKVATRGLPPNPPVLECCGYSHNSLRLRWGDGKNLEYIQYTLEMENHPSKSFSVVYQGTSHCHKVSKLQELTTYNFRIFASNSEGDGPYSKLFSFTTPKAIPAALKAPKVSSVTETSCVVEWAPAKSIGDDVLSYKLQVGSKFSDYRVAYSGIQTNHTLHNLQPNTEYSVRVCGVRHCSDGSGELSGPFSTSTVFCTNHSVSSSTQPKTVSTVTSFVERKPLTDQQWAIIILCGFTVLAVLVAILIEPVLRYSKS